MNDYKSSTQNFDSSYIYKVEEREESEKIVCHSDRGLVSIETNELPKVTRYFLKNNKGEPQGYIERKLILNYNPDTTDDVRDNFDGQNCTSDKIMLQPVPHKENTKMVTASQTTLKSRKTLDRFGKKFHWRQEPKSPSPLNSSAFERRKNYTPDCPSLNSTSSGRTFDIKKPARAADSSIERCVKRQPMNEKSFAKLTAKKSERLFCNDPNKRLKNLFTIVKPSEKFKDSANVTNDRDTYLLNKTKDLLVKLIDDELQRIRPDEDAGSPVDKRALKKLKLECIGKIEDQLELMRRLQA